MKGHHPHRRKDKYNPYTIKKTDNHYYLSFRDGNNICQELEISEQLYEMFNNFELEDLKHLNIVDRHLEQSEMWETSLNTRVVHKATNIEDVVIEKLQIEKLYEVIDSLTLHQKRRVLMYYFEDMTYEQIAEIEKCSKVAVKYSLDIALKKMKKILEN